MREQQRKEKISVIVAVYDEEEYIDSCIESIVKQTYQNLEIILVDDGSPDNCPEICDKWAEKDERILVIHKNNGGLVSARQAGMRAATGKYVCYVDGDDWIDRDTYENLMNTMQASNADIVIAGFQKDLFGKKIECYNNIPEGIYDKEKLALEVFPKMICDGKLFHYGVHTYVWNKLFKKDLIFQHQMNIDPRIVIGEDAACVYPAILDANVIAVTKYNGYHYRQRMNSLLRKVTRGNENIKKLQLFYEYLKGVFWSSPYKDILERQLFHFYINHLIMMSDALVSVCPKLGSNFPFMCVPIKSKVIIYSAGAYGIHLYQQLQESGQYDIVAWVDPDYEQYQSSKYEIFCLRDALKHQFDFIIIASVDKIYIQKTKSVLQQYKVDEKRIVSIEEDMDKVIQKLIENNMIDIERS